MTGNRRELPRSKLAGHRRAVPHRTLEGSPCGRTHPLLEAERFAGCQMVRSGCSVAIAQTKPASSRAQATTIFCWGLPRPDIRCQHPQPRKPGRKPARAASPAISSSRRSSGMPTRRRLTSSLPRPPGTGSIRRSAIARPRLLEIGCAGPKRPRVWRSPVELVRLELTSRNLRSWLT